MPKFIEKPKVQEIIIAHQWFPGKQVEGVITNDPWKPTGGFMDRFTDRGDIYIILQGIKETVREGNWIITHSDGSKTIATTEWIEKYYDLVEI